MSLMIPGDWPTASLPDTLPGLTPPLQKEGVTSVQSTLGACTKRLGGQLCVRFAEAQHGAHLEGHSGGDGHGASSTCSRPRGPCPCRIDRLPSPSSVSLPQVTVVGEVKPRAQEGSVLHF